jgi:hypothetical protein
MAVARFVFIGLSLLAAPVWAAPAPAPAPAPAEAAAEEGDILVTARSREMLGDFVHDMGEAGRNNQLARWDRTFCTAALGLDEGQAAFLSQRIAAIGRRLDLRAGGDGCRPSVLIVFTPNADGFAAGLARRFPITLSSEGRARLNRFVRTARPVRWVARTDLAARALPNSRLTLATRAELQLMLVVVDATKIDGYSLGELADYLAVVALANPRFGAAPSRASVLAMFERPRDLGSRFALTPFDQAYLSGLYGAPERARAADQQRSILSAMERDADRKGKR